MSDLACILYQLKKETYLKPQWALNPVEGKRLRGLMAAAACLVRIASGEK